MKATNKMTAVIAPVIAVILIVLVWEIAVKAAQIPEKLLPAPTVIFHALVKNFPSVISKDLVISLKSIAIGYAMAVPIGFVIAAVCSQFKLVVRAVTPVLIILMVTPMTTLVPIFKLFWGADTFLKLVVIVLQMAPVVALNSLTGFANPPKSNVDVMKAMGCGMWTTFFKVALPNALPQVFTGLKLGCILGTIASMVADMAVGQGGLGYRIMIYASFASTASAFATILVAAAVGVLLFQLVSAVERLLTAWN
ncbi:MAG: binding-protein-dependent transport system inner rane component [Oscillospiraceae bacterium]|nr:binding-protein-dependent transport system inner rane component [Oscillospiraceae bacterium]